MTYPVPAPQTIWATWWTLWVCSRPAPCSTSSPCWGPNQKTTDRPPSCCPAGWPPPSPLSAASTTNSEGEDWTVGIAALRATLGDSQACLENEEECDISSSWFSCHWVPLISHLGLQHFRILVLSKWHLWECYKIEIRVVQTFFILIIVEIKCDFEWSTVIMPSDKPKGGSVLTIHL